MTLANHPIIYSDDSGDPETCTHVVPVGDIRAHELTIHCWCQPHRDEECDDVIIHNSADGRERYEDGTRRPH